MHERLFTVKCNLLMLNIVCEIELGGEGRRGASWAERRPALGVVVAHSRCDHVMLTPRDRLAYSYTTYEIDTAGITLMKFGVMPRYSPLTPSRCIISRNAPRIVPSAPFAAFSVDKDGI